MNELILSEYFGIYSIPRTSCFTLFSTKLYILQDLLAILDGYNGSPLRYFSRQAVHGCFLYESMQCAAVKINFILIIEPPQRVAQFKSSKIACQGAFPSPTGLPLTILF